MVEHRLIAVIKTHHQSLDCVVSIHSGNHRQECREEASLCRTLGEPCEKYGNEADDKGGDGACQYDVCLEQAVIHEYESH